MFRQVASGGPGPTTLLFRQLRAEVARPTVKAPSLSAALLHSSALAADKSQRPRRPSPPKPIKRREASTPLRRQGDSSEPPLRTTSKAKGATEGEAAGSNNHTFIPDETTIYARPPIELFDIDGSLRLLREGLVTRNLKAAVKGWTRIAESGAVDLVPDEDYAAMSKFVATILNPPHRLMLGPLHAKLPAVYGALASMVVEAGARLHMSGLNEFFLQLVASGLPMETLGLYSKFVSRYRQLRGTHRDHLSDTNRETRLNARIKGEGVRLFQLIYIAALTQLNCFDSVALVSLLQTNANMNRSHLETEMRHIIRSANLKSSAKFSEQFRANVDKWTFAIQCYHHVALIEVIKQRAGSFSSDLLPLYERVLSSSIGPDRILIPLQSWDKPHEKVQSSILIPSRVWGHFIMAFARVGNTKQIEKMINIDLPAVYGSNLHIHLLALALYAMGWISAKPGLSHGYRQELGRKADVLWERIRDMGGELDHFCVGKRLEQLAQHGRHSEVEEVYRFTLKQLRLRGLPVSPNIDASYLMALCGARNFSGVMTFLESRVSEPTVDEGRAMGFMVGNVTGSPFPYAQRRAAFTLLMKRMHRDVVLVGSVWGRVMAFMLEGTDDIAKVVGFVARKEPAYNAGNFWFRVVEVLAVRGRAPTQTRLLASINILENHLVCDTSLSDFKQYWAFRFVCSAIVTSKHLSTDEIHQLLQYTIALIPADRPRVRLATISQLIRTCLNEDFGEGIAEAIYWFKNTEPQPLDYVNMVNGLFDHGQHAVAKEYALMAPPNLNNQFWQFVLKNFGVQRPTRARLRSAVATLEEAVQAEMAEEAEDGEAAMREDAEVDAEIDDSEDADDMRLDK